MSAVRIGVVSDTHIPGRARAVPASVTELFAGVDAILHAGDFVSPGVIDELAALAPTHGVAGNVDGWEVVRRVPERQVLEIGGASIGMVHDSGLSPGRRERLRRWFPGCRVVVFGHSHQPLVEDDGDLLLLNPGSPTDPRRARIPTVAILEIEDGEPRARLVPLAKGSAS